MEWSIDSEGYYEQAKDVTRARGLGWVLVQHKLCEKPITKCEFAPASEKMPYK